jgi:hypothetical protein
MPGKLLGPFHTEAEFNASGLFWMEILRVHCNAKDRTRFDSYIDVAKMGMVKIQIDNIATIAECCDPGLGHNQRPCEPHPAQNEPLPWCSIVAIRNRASNTFLEQQDLLGLKCGSEFPGDFADAKDLVE